MREDILDARNHGRHGRSDQTGLRHPERVADRLHDAPRVGVGIAGDFEDAFVAGLLGFNAELAIQQPHHGMKPKEAHKKCLQRAPERVAPAQVHEFVNQDRLQLAGRQRRLQAARQNHRGEKDSQHARSPLVRDHRASQRAAPSTPGRRRRNLFRQCSRHRLHFRQNAPAQIHPADDPCRQQPAKPHEPDDGNERADGQGCRGAIGRGGHHKRRQPDWPRQRTRRGPTPGGRAKSRQRVHEKTRRQGKLDECHPAECTARPRRESAAHREHQQHGDADDGGLPEMVEHVDRRPRPDGGKGVKGGFHGTLGVGGDATSARWLWRNRRAGLSGVFPSPSARRKRSCRTPPGARRAARASRRASR